MEMVRQYLGYDPLWNPSMQWNVQFHDAQFTYTYKFKETPIRKPQELVMKYLMIKEMQKNPMLLAA
ncbi:hypothetical protein ACWA2C_16855 [Priestia megaterium]